MQEHDMPKEQSSEHTSLPVLTVSAIEDDADEDGIFLSWPGGSTAKDKDIDEEEDDESRESDSLLSMRKKSKIKKCEKPDKKTAKEDAAEATRSFAFQRAAQSDAEESSDGKRKRNKGNADNEAALSSMKYYKHTRKVKERFLRRILPLFFVLLFLVGFILYFFRLQHLQFVNLTGYAPEDVFAAAGLKKNMFVFSIHEKDIMDKLRTDFPYIENIRVERQLPDTVSLVFTEDCARFYTQIYDEYFVISDTMRVLGRYDNEDAIPDQHLRKITLPAVSYAVVGHGLQFFDTSYLDFLSEVLTTIEASAIYDNIQSMDFSNRHYLQLTYDNRLLFDIGNADNLETKLLFVKTIVEDLESSISANITIVDNKMASVTLLSIQPQQS